MDQNMSVHFMAAQAEQKLVAARAEQAWRRMDSTPKGEPTGLLAAISTIVTRVRQAFGGQASLRTATSRRQSSASA